MGRCAGSILADYPNHLGVYIYAPYSERFKNCTQRLGMDADTAHKMIREVGPLPPALLPPLLP